MIDEGHTLTNKRCDNCIHWTSESEEFNDPLESNDYGRCWLFLADIVTTRCDDTCDKFEAIEDE